MTIHRVKLKDLNKEYLEKLQRQAANGEQEVAIWFPQKSTALSEDEFWEIIALLDWKKRKAKTIMAAATAHLSQLSEAKIKAFDDILSEKLYQLDGQQYAKNTGQNAYQGETAPFSVDGFLYARCMAVAQGKDTFDIILANPEKMVKDVSFEPLLGLANQAYQKKTGETYEHIPAYIYETFANTKGWNNKDFLANILS